MCFSADKPVQEIYSNKKDVERLLYANETLCNVCVLMFMSFLLRICAFA